MASVRFLQKVDGSDDIFPTCGPVRLISNGDQFYEVPLLSTPPPPTEIRPLIVAISRVDVEMNTVPSLAMEMNLVFVIF